jgi:GGDEF domain-containing protein
MTFSHDGLRDSLTHLAAPPYFYENLRRDLATAQRNKSQVSLVRFQLFPIGIIEVERESQYEVSILAFAELMKASIRSEDLCARLGRYEFTVILRTDEKVAQVLMRRILREWKSDCFACKAASIPAIRGESSLEILNRLDNQELIGVAEGNHL